MKKILIVLSLLIATFALSAQNINANFEVDEEGWTSHFRGYQDGCLEEDELCIIWSKLIPPMGDRGGISFSGKNYSNQLFLYIQKEVGELLPNTTYNITFNTSWVSQLGSNPAPTFVKVAVLNEEPFPVYEDLIKPSFDKGPIGQNSRDFNVIGRFSANPSGYPTQDDFHNLQNVYTGTTNLNGRLFLIIGVEPQYGHVSNIFLNTLRVVLTAAETVQPAEPAEPSSQPESTEAPQEASTPQ
ncbi:MAG: hypothetical protein LBU91_05535 [Bacteroidales bacterium]|jgi:hypothetical protein|nr:hypothetical protein [Bacteroidales bacterium]